jgi:drug/metabolite transporter (DMT)-like permease
MSWWPGLIAGSAGVLAFSGTLPATRAALSFFTPLAITSARIEIAALLGVGTLVATGQLRLPDREHWLGILWTGLGLAVGYPLFVAIALQHVPAAHGAVVIGLAPVATALIAVFRLGERPGPVFWLASITGVGAVLLFALHQGGGVTLADAWLVTAIASVGLAYVEGGRVSRALGGTVTLCWAMIVLAPFAAIPLIRELCLLDWTQPIGTAAWIGFWYAGVVSMFLGSVFWYRGLAAGGVARIGQLNLIQPLLALFWSALLLGERVTGTTVLCAVVVLGAMIVCIKSRVPVAIQADAK